MGKLIDADRLKEAFGHKTWYSSDEIIDEIADAQGVDAEQVIRCEKCECWDVEKSYARYGVCNRGGKMTRFDWYCADGKDDKA